MTRSTVPGAALRFDRLPRRKSRLIRVVAALVVTAGVLVPSAGAVPPAAALGTWSAAPGNIHGGGFQNVIAVGPAPNSTSPGRLLVGGDVSGVQISDDGGGSWRAGNRWNLPSSPTGADRPALHDLKVAALAWSKKTVTPNTVYSLRGDGTSGSLVRSLDGGQSWSFLTRSTGPGQVPIVGGAIKDGHPRPSGRLIALDEDRDRLFVGTVDGIFRVDGLSTPAALTASRLTIPADTPDGPFGSLVLDPTGTALFATVARTLNGEAPDTDAGLWRITNLDAVLPAKVELKTTTGRELVPHETVIVTERGQAVLYVVAGDPTTFTTDDADEGLFRCTGLLASTALPRSGGPRRHVPTSRSG